MAGIDSVEPPRIGNAKARRRKSRRARRDRYWRYRSIFARRMTGRQLIVVAVVTAVAVLLAMAWDYFTAPVGEDRRGPIALCHSSSQRNCLIDGDTGRDNGRKWRLISIDAPELAEPQCDNERRLAIASRDRLQQLLSADYRIRPSGRDDPNGRALVDILLPDGRDVGRILIAEGLAQRWPNRGNVWCEHR